MANDQRPVQLDHTTATRHRPDREPTLPSVLEERLRILQAWFPSVTADRMLLDDAIDRYLLHLAASRRSPRTITGARSILGRFAAFIEQASGTPPTLVNVTIDVARAYIVALQASPRYIDHPYHDPHGRLSPATVNQHARGLRAFAHWLEEEGHTADHRLRRLRPPNVPAPELRPLDAAEIERLLGVLDAHDPRHQRTAAIIALLFDTGMRTGELVRLRLADVRWETGEIRVLGKGEKRRVVVAGQRARKFVQRYLDRRRRAWRMRPISCSSRPRGGR